MKKENREIYVSTDNKIFELEYQCKEYEKNIELESRRKEFIARNIENAFKEYNAEVKVEIYILEDTKPHNNTIISEQVYKDDDFFYELNEGMPISIEDFDDITEDIYISTGFKINIPIYYWSK